MATTLQYGPFGFRTRWAVAGLVAAVLLGGIGWFTLVRQSSHTTLACTREGTGDGTCIIGNRTAESVRFDVGRLTGARPVCSQYSCWDVFLCDDPADSCHHLGPTTKQAAAAAVGSIRAFVADSGQSSLWLELTRPDDEYLLGALLALPLVVIVAMALVKVLSGGTRFRVELGPAGGQVVIRRYWLALPLGQRRIPTEGITDVDVDEMPLDRVAASLLRGIAPAPGWRISLHTADRRHHALTRRPYGRRAAHRQLAARLREALGLPSAQAAVDRDAPSA